jgi:tetratricopeptide (TPR) repeat protein
MLRLETAGLCVALAALTVVAYSPVWKNGLVDFDDELYISTNSHVMDGLSWPGVQWAFANYHGNYWQPAAWLSLQLDAHFFATRSRGGKLVASAAAIHAQNLLWHCGSVLLLFVLWRRLTGATGRSFLIAALFAVHPMHVESVAWAAERKDVLSVFFGILTLWVYVWYVAKPGVGRYLCVAAAFALSLMSKPMLMTLPFVLLLLDYWPLRRDRLARSASERPSLALQASNPAGFVSWAWLLLEKVPLLVLAAAAGVVTMIARQQTHSVVSWNVIPLSARLANAVTGYGWYIARTFYPLQLGALYPHPGRNWSLPPALAGIVLLIAVTLLAAWQARRRHWLLCGWLWFVGTLIPVIGLAQGGEQAWADRFSYWPHIGLFVALVWTLGELVERWRIPTWFSSAAAGLILICLSVLTWIQVGYWRDTLTLWTRAAAVTQDNDVAELHLGYHHLNRAVYYIDLGVPQRAELEFAEAAPHFTEAVRVQPDVAVYRGYLGQVLLAQGKTAEAAKHLQIAADRAPEDADAWYNLGMARLRLQEPEAAIGCFRQVVDLLSSNFGKSPSDPKKVEALTGLGLAQLAAGKRSNAAETFLAALDLAPRQGEAWYGLGDAYLAQGQLDEAVAALRKAVHFGPHLVRAHSDLGLALGRQGQWSQAVPPLREAVRMQDQGGAALEKMTGTSAAPDDVPDLVVYLCRLAYAQKHLGPPDAAAAAYAAASRRDPRWPVKFTAKAWKLATHPDANFRDPRLAFELASQAAEASADPPAVTLDGLAAAQAALGQFPEAVQTAKQALKKARDAGDKSLAQSVQEHLRHYEKGECVRAPSP